MYNKPNPFYTKNERLKRKQSTDNDNDDDTPRPVYKHETVTQETLPSNPIEHFQIPTPTTSTKSSQLSTHSHAYSSSQLNSQKSSSFHYSAPHSSYSYNPTSSPESTYSVQTYASYPSSGYGVPPSYYPSSSYGAPPLPSYGPPPPTMTSMPEAQKSHGEWFLSKLLKKFDLILVSKIMLKLIIFKKIIKFIGIICLLMFIPILKKKFEESYDSSEEDGRRIKFLDDYSEFRVYFDEVTFSKKFNSIR